MPKFSQRSLIQHEREIGAGDSMRQAAKPVDEHRYPRGYTPERQAAVSSALAGVEVVSKFHDHRSQDSTKASPYVSSSQFFTPDPAMGEHQGNWKHTQEERHDIISEQARRVSVDTYARSTVPLEHLAHHPALHIEVTNNAGGDYTNPGHGPYLEGPYAPGHGRIRVNPRSTPDEASHTLIHELGHHRDFVNDPEAFEQRSWNRVSHPQVGTASPGLEGYAEGYAQKHTRERGGGMAKRLSYRDFIPQHEFAHRYAEASGGMKAHEHPSVQPAQSRAMPGVDEPHLYQRQADIADTRTEKDYGQFPLTVPWADRDPDFYDPVHLGTIKTGRGVPSNTAAEGFRPGDADIVQAMRWGGGAAKKYAIPVEERKRVADTWNAKYPEDYVHHD